MTGLLQTVAALPTPAILFSREGTPITAGQVRQTAIETAARLPSGTAIYLHTESAALFVAGLMAAALRQTSVFCPAHLQPHYLQEIGAEHGVVLSDENPAIASLVHLDLAEDEAETFDIGSDLSLAFFTSGVTSTPKLVRKTIHQLDREAATLDSLWGAVAGPVYATVSHQHIYGMLFRIFWPVLTGRVSQDRPAETWEPLAAQFKRGGTLVSSPAHLTRLPNDMAVTSPGLVFSSGAPLPFSGAQAAQQCFGSLPYEVLGSTETGGIAWRQQDNPDALWTPFADVQTTLDATGVLTVASAVAGDTPVITGDIAEFVGAQFRLKGRGDLIAKVDGNRVSLPRVEQAVQTLPMVEAVAVIDLPQRNGSLGAIVELNDTGRAAYHDLGAFRLSRKLREDLAGRLEPRERPKHWLFAPIPLDRQGKRIKATLRAKFAQADTDALGILTTAAVDGDKAELLLDFEPDLIWFQGHFPGQPVLPGIAQVHLAMQWAECLWGFRPFGAQISQLKFRRVVRPGRQIRLRLERDTARQRLTFAFEFDGIIASEGKVGGVP